jgi:hypothetical protein
MMGYRLYHLGRWPTVFSASGEMKTASLKSHHMANDQWRNNPRLLSESPITGSIPRSPG